MNKLNTLYKLATIFWFTLTIGNTYSMVDDINNELDVVIDLIRGDI